MKYLSALILANILIVPAAVHAQSSGPALAAKNGCLACHAGNKKIVGPSFASIAKKYENDPGAQARLKQKIGTGSAGVWGPVPGACGRGVKIADDDKTALINYVRSIK